MQVRYTIFWVKMFYLMLRTLQTEVYRNDNTTVKKILKKYSSATSVTRT